MGWRDDHDKVENLKCDWVNLCLEVKQGMRRRGIKTIPLTRRYDETYRATREEMKENARKNRPVGADSRAV